MRPSFFKAARSWQPCPASPSCPCVFMLVSLNQLSVSLQHPFQLATTQKLACTSGCNTSYKIPRRVLSPAVPVSCALSCCRLCYCWMWTSCLLRSCLASSVCAKSTSPPWSTCTTMQSLCCLLSSLFKVVQRANSWLSSLSKVLFLLAVLYHSCLILSPLCVTTIMQVHSCQARSQYWVPVHAWCT